MSESPEPDRESLAKVARQVPGKWLAVDRRTNQLKLVADSPYDLAARIKQAGLKNIAVVRAPDPSEPELVGLG